MSSVEQGLPPRASPPLQTRRMSIPTELTLSKHLRESLSDNEASAAQTPATQSARLPEEEQRIFAERRHDEQEREGRRAATHALQKVGLQHTGLERLLQKRNRPPPPSESLWGEKVGTIYADIRDPKTGDPAPLNGDVSSASASLPPGQESHAPCPASAPPAAPQPFTAQAYAPHASGRPCFPFGSGLRAPKPYRNECRGWRTRTRNAPTPLDARVPQYAIVDAHKTYIMGTWVDSYLHGRGLMRFASGSTYEGEFKNGLMDGHGHWKGVHGESYLGGWRMSFTHGPGLFTWPDGSTYHGDWHWGVSVSRARRNHASPSLFLSHIHSFVHLTARIDLGRVWPRLPRTKAQGNTTSGGAREECDAPHNICDCFALSLQVMWGNGKYVKRSGDLTEYCGQFANGQRHGNGRLKFVRPASPTSVSVLCLGSTRNVRAQTFACVRVHCLSVCLSVFVHKCLLTFPLWIFHAAERGLSLFNLVL